MTAKEYLQQLQRLDIIIDQKVKELDDLRIISKNINGIDYSKDRVQISPLKDANFTYMVEKMITIEMEINKEIRIFVIKRHEIINRIQRLKNLNYINLLYKRYVEFKKFEDIGIEMNFTYQYIKELHRYALQEFEKTYTNLL